MSNNLWIEKYRPIKIEDIILEENIKIEIDKIIQNKNIPNMILTGIPGIGKTTTLLCLARKLYGKYMNDTVLELNASDERGIKLINSGELNNFCNQKLPYSSEEQQKYANHKLIIFDEADNMTEKALPIISILMDKFHNSTRFVFTCNTSSKIIESIQSRCKIIRYIRLSNDKVSDRLETILKLEKIKYQKKALDEIGLLSGGDMRLAINLLQLVSDRFKNVTIDNIEILCETPPHNVINDILTLAKKDVKKALSKTFELKESGYSINDIFIGFFNYFKSPNNMSEDTYKMSIIIIISEYMYNVLKYSDTDINLTSFILDISQIKS
jgi:replication factor C subunit 2/4